MADPSAVTVLFAAACGLLFSVGIEALIKPRPSLQRPRASWAEHAGLWLIMFGVLALLLGRPWFAVAGVSAFLLLLVLVNNAKMKSLREPFVFQDFEYFTDAITHPRLYIPFFGWARTLTATTGFVLAVLAGWWLEEAPADRVSWSGQLGGVAVVLLLGIALLGAAWRACLAVSFDPLRDMRELGLLSSLWRYGRAERAAPSLKSPFASLATAKVGSVRPHLVAVQSESFFDPRPLFAGIRPDVLAEFDRIKAAAIAHGRLAVPAWGANTVRSEFAFLSAIVESALGVHRFNPYRKAVRAGIETLASFLKRLGYRTVCVHPYPASFYARDRIFPLLGFDEFIDIDDFSGAQRCGPYVGDKAVAEKIASIVEMAKEPVFVFAITMENHGPLHLEKASEEDVARLYAEPPPAGCNDLTIYLRHLRNADDMLARLTAVLSACSRPSGLCWFGDHVPIMSEVYDAVGAPDGDTEYLVWRNASAACPADEKCIEAHSLAFIWLRAMGMVS